MHVMEHIKMARAAETKSREEAESSTQSDVFFWTLTLRDHLHDTKSLHEPSKARSKASHLRNSFVPRRLARAACPWCTGLPPLNRIGHLPRWTKLVLHSTERHKGIEKPWNSVLAILVCYRGTKMNEVPSGQSWDPAIPGSMPQKYTQTPPKWQHRPMHWCRSSKKACFTPIFDHSAWMAKSFEHQDLLHTRLITVVWRWIHNMPPGTSLHRFQEPRWGPILSGTTAMENFTAPTGPHIDNRKIHFKYDKTWLTMIGYNMVPIWAAKLWPM